METIFQVAALLLIAVNAIMLIVIQTNLNFKLSDHEIQNSKTNRELDRLLDQACRMLDRLEILDHDIQKLHELNVISNEKIESLQNLIDRNLLDLKKQLEPPKPIKPNNWGSFKPMKSLVRDGVDERD